MRRFLRSKVLLHSASALFRTRGVAARARGDVRLPPEERRCPPTVTGRAPSPECCCPGYLSTSCWPRSSSGWWRQRSRRPHPGDPTSICDLHTGESPGTALRRKVLDTATETGDGLRDRACGRINGAVARWCPRGRDACGRDGPGGGQQCGGDTDSRRASPSPWRPGPSWWSTCSTTGSVSPRPGPQRRAQPRAAGSRVWWGTGGAARADRWHPPGVAGPFRLTSGWATRRGDAAQFTLSGPAPPRTPPPRQGEAQLVQQRGSVGGWTCRPAQPLHHQAGVPALPVRIPCWLAPHGRSRMRRWAQLRAVGPIAVSVTHRHRSIPQSRRRGHRWRSSTTRG